MHLCRTIPSLPVRNVAAAAAFYADKLGFVGVHVDTGIAVLARDDAVIHLWCSDHEGWRTRPDLTERPVASGAESFLSGTASCRVEVDDVDALYAELAPRGILHPTDRGEPVATDWGTLEFHTLDLDGNLLTFFRVVTS